MTAPLTDAELDSVSAFADRIVARGLMSAASVEIETMRRLALEYRAGRAVLQEIRAVVDATASTTRDEVAQLRAALKEACDWATPFNERHDRAAGGYESERLPMYTRVGDRMRADRLTALQKLTKDNP
jgi:hypothetical protein